MDTEDKDYDGSYVLERLAEIGRVDDFYDAIDDDNFAKARKLMQEAELDYETIQQVLQKMKDGDDDI